MTQEQQDKQAEDREAFYMQYFGQFVLTAIDRDINKIGCGVSIYNMSLLLDGTFSDHYLELKSLSAITDEDAIEVAKIVSGNELEKFILKDEFRVLVSCGNDDIGIWFDGEILMSDNEQYPLLVLGCYDYLRSRGYLLPFRQYSKQQLLDMGWAKIEE